MTFEIVPVISSNLSASVDLPASTCARMHVVNVGREEKSKELDAEEEGGLEEV